MRELKILLKRLRAFTGILAIAIFLSLVTSVLTLIQPLILQHIINQFGSEPFTLWTFPVLILVLILSFSFIFSVLKELLTARLAIKFAASLREEIVMSIAYLKLEIARKWAPGDLISRSLNDTSVIQKGIEEDLVEVPSVFILGLGSAIALVMIDPVSAVLVGILFLTIMGTNRIGSRAIAKRTQSKQELLSEGTQNLSSLLNSFFTMKAYMLEHDAIQRFKRVNSEITRSGLALSRVFSLVFPINSLLAQITLIVIFGIGAFRVSSGDITVATLTGFMLYLTLMLSPISRIGTAVSNFGAVVAAVRRLNEIHNLEQCDVSVKKTSKSLIQEDENEKFSLNTIEKVELRDISFTYPGSKNPAIASISLELDRKGLIVISGESGSGKSTLANIISGIYGFATGRVFGVDKTGAIFPLDQSHLRKMFVMVPQLFEEWGTTVRQSLVLDNEFIRDEDILRIGQQIGLSKFFKSLSFSLDTPLSFVVSNASGGELRRLGILRGLLREPDMLILDEPTANLDRHNAESILALVHEISVDRLVVVITHDNLDWNPSFHYQMVDGQIKKA